MCWFYLIAFVRMTVLWNSCLLLTLLMIFKSVHCVTDSANSFDDENFRTPTQDSQQSKVSFLSGYLKFEHSNTVMAFSLQDFTFSTLKEKVESRYSFPSNWIYRHSVQLRLGISDMHFFFLSFLRYNLFLFVLNVFILEIIHMFLLKKSICS